MIKGPVPSQESSKDVFFMVLELMTLRHFFSKEVSGISLMEFSVRSTLIFKIHDAYVPK